jgi:hypothetical protein
LDDPLAVNHAPGGEFVREVCGEGVGLRGADADDGTGAEEGLIEVPEVGTDDDRTGIVRDVGCQDRGCPSLHLIGQRPVIRLGFEGGSGHDDEKWMNRCHLEDPQATRVVT